MPGYLYFAYGSNMLTERLVARTRTARRVGVAQAVGWTLSFGKRSLDRSGKAMLARTGRDADVVPGVLYEIDLAERADLDRIEGAGYLRADGFPLARSDTGEGVTAAVYLAEPTHVETSLRPYDWYRSLVLAGARQHGLPMRWIARLERFASSRDPDAVRRDAARAMLERAGYAHLLPMPAAAD